MKNKKTTEWKRKCPNCGEILYYATKYNMIEAENKKRVCSKCKSKNKEKNFLRNCPKCNEIIWYKHKENRDRAVLNKILCRRCIGKKLGSPMRHLNFIFSEDHRKKISISTTKRQLGKKYSEERVKNMIEGLVKMPYDEYIKTVPELKKYRKKVLKFTYKNNLSILDGYLIKGNHLDHIFSIAEGFRRNIPAELIGDIQNLQYIDGIENRKKSDKIIRIPKHIRNIL